ncbi:50S ribosomal protein L9 [uncultured Porphyromonas sp.]|uniref:50S ribosomal protein L9 n=1 Tax=uncultured Porphyromonas sp. TaxID=159274 RepID=UPI00259A6E1F|nr:50S ribosomal protein L9 [uncultured Porphyromonas sp.]
MKIILKEDMPNLGFKGEIVDVKAGYGRNFLIPQGKAVIASESAIKILQENQRQQARKLEAELANAQKIADKIEGTSLTIEVKTSNVGRIYGSVSASMVADELEKLGFTEINRKMLQVPGIKEVGEYIARVRLHKDVTVEVPLTIVSDTPIVKAEPKTEKAETSEEVEETTKEENAEVEQATTEE